MRGCCVCGALGSRLCFCVCVVVVFGLLLFLAGTSSSSSSPQATALQEREWALATTRVATGVVPASGRSDADVTPAQVSAQAKAIALGSLLGRWRAKVFELLVQNKMAERSTKRVEEQLRRTKQLLAAEVSGRGHNRRGGIVVLGGRALLTSACVDVVVVVCFCVPTFHGRETPTKEPRSKLPTESSQSARRTCCCGLNCEG